VILILPCFLFLALFCFAGAEIPQHQRRRSLRPRWRLKERTHSRRLQKENLELSSYSQKMEPTFDFDDALESIEMLSEENVNLKVEKNGLKQQVAIL
jgi:hypothetical protein